jgi:hypothetical protein
MGYLDTLNHRGIRASIRRNDTLWLDPQSLVTPDVAEMVRAHKDDILLEIRDSAGSLSADIPEVVPDYHFLWVATTLESFEEFDPRFGYELNCEPVYRMLDAPYYAWLRHRMENARTAHGSRRLDDSTFETLKTRFNAVHTWAVQYIGEDVLRQAVRTTNVKSYVPPSEQTFMAYQKTWDDAEEAYRSGQAANNRSDQVGRLGNLLATQGYAGIKSPDVDDVVIFVRDDGVTVPNKWAGKVKFTIDELTLMVGTPVETVKQIYDIKQIFGGKVVPQDDGQPGVIRQSNDKQLRPASSAVQGSMF